MKLTSSFFAISSSNMQQVVDDSTAVEDADQLVPGCLPKQHENYVI